MLDDKWNIEINPHLKMQAFNIESIKAAMQSGESGPLKRPIAMLSFAINHYFTGDSVFWMKLTNLAIHLLSSCILLLILKKLFKRLKPYNTNEKIILSAPYLITIVWLLHPINVTAVSYVVQRMTSLSTFFMLLTIHSYVSIRENPPGKLSVYASGLFLVLFWILGIFTKENAALTGLLLLLLEVFLYRFKTQSNIAKVQVWIILAITCLPILFGAIYVLYNWEVYFVKKYMIRDFNPWERLLTESRVLIEYLSLIILPDVNNMGIFRDDFKVSRSLLEPLSTLFSILLLSGLIFTAWIYRKKYQLAAIGAFWFLACHLMESTVISLELSFLHRNYLAVVGVLLIATELLIILSKINSRLCGIIIITYLMIFTFSTRNLAWDWSNQIDHLTVDALQHPDSLRAVSQAGMMYFLASLRNQEDSDEQAELIELSDQYFAKAYELKPFLAINNYVWKLRNYVTSGRDYPEELLLKIKSLYPETFATQNLLTHLNVIKNCIIENVDCSMTKEDFRDLLDHAGNMSFYNLNHKAYYLDLYASFLYLVEHDYYGAIEKQKLAVKSQPEFVPLHINLFTYYRKIPLVNEMNNSLQMIVKYDTYHIYEDKIAEFTKDIENASRFIKENNIEIK